MSVGLKLSQQLRDSAVEKHDLTLPEEGTQSSFVIKIFQKKEKKKTVH